jgi:hypothetical protein
MKPIVFSDYCTVFSGAGEIADLPVLTTHYLGLGKAIISCWRPSWGELLLLLFTRKVYVTILGEKQPPMAVSVDEIAVGIPEANEAHATAGS